MNARRSYQHGSKKFAVVHGVHYRDLVAEGRIPTRVPVPTRRKSGLKRIVLHCTAARASWGWSDLIQYAAGPNGVCRKGCPCPFYGYLVHADGEVFKLAQDGWLTYHAGPWHNRRALAVALAYRGGAENVPEKQLEAAVRLVAALAVEYEVQSRDCVGHRELPWTGYNPITRRLRKVCPGMKIDLEAFRSAVRDEKLRIRPALA